AIFARDALAKSIYSNLFDWIVQRINSSLKAEGDVHNFIGVLDIYGFETFATNSFEQFCINYANEKLQQQFNMHVFKLEEDDYMKEGIEWEAIGFYDSQPCIDLIENKLGILDLLDEECRMPRGTDRSWVEKLIGTCRKWHHFSQHRLHQTSFVVQHFAGKVEYESEGFLNKNRDCVLEEHVSLMKESSNSILSELFCDTISHHSSGMSPTNSVLKNKARRTVGSQFKDSLNFLVQSLSHTTPHYVRCIKPNDSKAPFRFDANRSVLQLRACGVLETKLRSQKLEASGEVIARTVKTWMARKKYLHLITAVRILQRLTRGFVARKKAKLLRKVRAAVIVQAFRTKALTIALQARIRGFRARTLFVKALREKKSIIIQKYVKGSLQRRKYLKMRRHIVVVQCAIRRWLSIPKTLEHQKNLNKSLQRRVIDLQDNWILISIDTDLNGYKEACSLSIQDCISILETELDNKQIALKVKELNHKSHSVPSIHIDSQFFKEEEEKRIEALSDNKIMPHNERKSCVSSKYIEEWLLNEDMVSKYSRLVARHETQMEPLSSNNEDWQYLESYMIPYKSENLAHRVVELETLRNSNPESSPDYEIPGLGYSRREPKSSLYGQNSTHMIRKTQK
ncbi:Myosin 5, partial [Caligus rogercresseyi]